MMEIAQLENLIGKLNYERHVFFEILPKQSTVFQGTIVLPNEKLVLKIDFSNYFPLEFPIFSIENAQRFYPHVDNAGKICLFDDSSLLIQTDMPDQMLLDAFDRAVDILCIDPESYEYKTEVVREFNAYWAEVSKMILYTNLSSCMGKEYQNLSVVRAENRLLVSENIVDSECLLKNNFGVSLERKSNIDCLLIRLRSSCIPPIQKMYTWKWLRNFITKNITSSQKKAFNLFLTRKRRIFNQFLILSIPSENQDIIVSFHIFCKNSQFRKIEKMINCTVTPVTTRPIDYNFLLKRCGENINLAEKSVLLLGCGSVGSYVASNLCQSGICKLDILDKDILSVENVYRHLLGFDVATKRKNKADLVKEFLEKQYPYVEIDSLNFIDRSVESFIRDVQRLKNYDLIISALGEPTVNLELNRILYDKNVNVPFVVCFNEPYGIGGHVIAINNSSGGCLRCMYTDLISSDLVPFRASLVAPGQNFKKSLSGCAGSFVEYSALDSQQTALLTVRLSLEVLTGQCKESTLISWIGSEDNLINNGFEVSEYYEHISGQSYCSITRKNIPINERCPICSEKQD